jgi:hypothetical protein
MVGRLSTGDTVAGGHTQVTQLLVLRGLVGHHLEADAEVAGDRCRASVLVNSDQGRRSMKVALSAVCRMQLRRLGPLGLTARVVRHDGDPI